MVDHLTLRHTEGRNLVVQDSKCLALTTLCENPQRKTGLTTFFHGLVSSALKLYPNVHWLIFAGPKEDWPEVDKRVRIIRSFPANDRLLPRVWADHIKVPAVAKQMGADVLLTVGFVPVRKLQPTVMSLLALLHVDSANKIGGMRQLYRRLMTRWGIAGADLVITNSFSAASQITNAFPQIAPKLIVSHEGLQTEQFVPEKEFGEDAELKRRFEIEPGYFLWVSNFQHYRQADLLLEGYASLDVTLRLTHPLVMVGGGWNGGDLSASARARALGIESNVRFLGWVEDRWLAPLYRNAVAFCLASREETFGRSVIEAMACGTPCVVNNIPIMHEVTAGHALIVDFKNRNETTTALNRIVSEQDLHDRLRSEGLRRAADFSFEKMTRERIDAILELLAKVKS
jgi:glycosyltransferase involved in cell wall biosynthesis